MTASSAPAPISPLFNGQRSTGRPRTGQPRSIPLRTAGERAVMALLITFGAFTILTTLAIIYTLSHETWRFFQFDEVSLGEFFLGLHWSPLLGSEKHFGVWPLVAGTAMITLVAMAFAGPLGVITAIWLAEYAPRRLRNCLKPVLEILAGVPTVVLGFFALTFITPALQFAFIQQPAMGPDGQPMLDANGAVITQAWNPLGIEGYNVLAAGIAVGILSLPVVTSLTEDALRAVPRALREGSYGLGATRFETSVKVVFPAALSGVIAAFLLAVARCVGETMIVALAAGAAHLPLYQVTDPPLVAHQWRVAGDRAGSAGGADSAAGGPVAMLTANQPHSLGAFAVGEDERIDAVEVLLEPNSAATFIDLELAGPTGRVLARERLDVPASADKPIPLTWRIPPEAPSALAEAGPAPIPGRHVGQGEYNVRLTAINGDAALRWVAVEGQRYMSLASRLAMPFDVTRSAQPMTGYLVQIFLGDVSNLGVEYYSSYAVAALLFIFTFILTLLGHFIRVRFQQQYE